MTGKQLADFEKIKRWCEVDLSKKSKNLTNVEILRNCLGELFPQGDCSLGDDTLIAYFNSFVL